METKKWSKLRKLNKTALYHRHVFRSPALLKMPFGRDIQKTYMKQILCQFATFPEFEKIIQKTLSWKKNILVRIRNDNI